MKIKYYILLLSIFCTSVLNAKSKYEYEFKKRNSIQLQILGQTGLLSIGYERILVNNHKFKTSASSFGFYYDRQFIQSTQITEIITMSKFVHFEVGFGLTSLIRFSDSRNFYLKDQGIKSLLFGVRFQNNEGRYILKMVFTPLLVNQTTQLANGSISELTTTPFMPWFGATVGYAF